MTIPPSTPPSTPPSSTPPGDERRSGPPRGVPRSSTPRAQLVPLVLVTVLLLVLITWVTSIQRNAHREMDRRAAEGTYPVGDTAALRR